MYILTNKALAERENEAWKKGNSHATKAWQNEFELQNKEYNKKINDMLNMLEKIVLDNSEELNSKTTKARILEIIKNKQNELLDTIKLLKGE